MARTGLDITGHLSSEERAAWDESFRIPTTIHECTTQLREAKRLVQEIVDFSFVKREQEQREKIRIWYHLHLTQIRRMVNSCVECRKPKTSNSCSGN